MRVIARFLCLALAWLIAFTAGMLTAGFIADLTSRQRTPPSSLAVLALPVLLLVAVGLTFARRLFPPVRHADRMAQHVAGYPRLGGTLGLWAGTVAMTLLVLGTDSPPGVRIRCGLACGIGSPVCGVVIGARWGKVRIAHPQCPECGYNLTGLTSDRCPECGSGATRDDRVPGGEAT